MAYGRVSVYERQVVYVIGGKGGPLKIGISTNPDERKRQLASDYGRKLRVLHTFKPSNAHAYEVERYVHRILKEKRHCGEWFRVTLDEAIEAIITADKNAPEERRIYRQWVSDVEQRIKERKARAAMRKETLRRKADQLEAV